MMEILIYDNLEIIRRCGPTVFNIKDTQRLPKVFQALLMHGYGKLDKYSSIGLSRKQHFELHMISYYPKIYGKKHQLYSPDLAPMNFSVFLKLRLVYTGGKSTKTTTIEEAIRSSDAQWYLETFAKWSTNTGNT
jgi:hypothetical protein